MAWVLDHSPTEGGDRLVLLSIANHAGKTPVRGSDGLSAWEAWPGLTTIGSEAGLSRRQSVKDALRRLEQAGHLQRIVNGAPDGRLRRDRRPNLYRIVIDGGTRTEPPSRGCGGTPTEPASARHGGTRDEGPFDEPASLHGGTLSARTGAREPSPKPSLNPADAETFVEVHSRAAVRRAADAVRLLAARDVERNPDADPSSSLAARESAHRWELTRLAQAHPQLDAVALADALTLAESVDPARRRSDAHLGPDGEPQSWDHETTVAGIAGARQALRTLGRST